MLHEYLNLFRSFAIASSYNVINLIMNNDICVDSLALAYNKLNKPFIAQTRFSKRQIFIFLVIVSVHFIILMISIFRNTFPLIADIVLLSEAILLTLLVIIPCLLGVVFIVRMNDYEDTLFPNDLIETCDALLPTYTVLCPLYREGNIVQSSIKTLSEIDYPVEKLEILILLEKDDSDTWAALPQNLPPHFKVVEIPLTFPRTKPKALNHGLKIASGQFLVVYDAEDIPPRNQLRNAVRAFRSFGDDVWAVQAKLSFVNPEDNWLSLLLYAEFCFWFDSFLPYLQRNGYPVSLGGTSNHFRVDKLREIGGWDAFNVTEDADMALRIYKRNKKVALLRSRSSQRSPVKARTWIKQRSRWLKGLMQTVLVHSRMRLTKVLLKYLGLTQLTQIACNQDRPNTTESHHG